MHERNGCNNPEYRELISAYIDGDLNIAERQTLLAHLATCEDCRSALEAYRQIGGQLRALPPVAPPLELRNAIYSATVDNGSRKLYIFGSRVGYSVAALAAVVLIFVVAIYLLINGYQRSIDPEVVASQPGHNVIWPLSRPIEITFNKEMDRESVESALSISPASEKDRLTISWDGNTLILGENQTLRPDSTYSISITTGAQDKWGTKLESDFKLQFATSDSFALQTPVPIPTPTTPPTATLSPTETQDAEPTERQQPGAFPTQTPRSATATPDTEAGAIPTTNNSSGEEPSAPAPTATNVPPPDLDVPDEEPELPLPTATPDVPEPAPTSVPTTTPTPRPTATPEPTWTPRPLPTATQQPTATPEPPEPTATPDTIPVVGAFGNVYWSNQVVEGRLGAPSAAAYSIEGIELDFQHGAMFSRSDTAQTYVLESGSAFWSELPSSSEPTDSAPGPIEDTWVPGGSLGTLWAAELWIQDALGHALAPSGQVFESRVQSFENGAMLMSSSGQIYVLYLDGTWELYPDPGA